MLRYSDQEPGLSATVRPSVASPASDSARVIVLCYAVIRRLTKPVQRCSRLIKRTILCCAQAPRIGSVIICTVCGLAVLSWFLLIHYNYLSHFFLINFMSNHYFLDRPKSVSCLLRQVRSSVWARFGSFLYGGHHPASRCFSCCFWYLLSWSPCPSSLPSFISGAQAVKPPSIPSGLCVRVRNGFVGRMGAFRLLYFCCRFTAWSADGY